MYTENTHIGVDGWMDGWRKERREGGGNDGHKDGWMDGWRNGYDCIYNIHSIHTPYTYTAYIHSIPP